MNKDTNNETKQETQSALGITTMERDFELPKTFALEKTFSLAESIITAQGTSFVATDKNVQQLLSSIHNQVNNFINIALGAKNPAVDIAQSVTDDYIICLEDNEKVKILRKHLKTKYGMTPKEYIKKWNLDASYPFVAPSYSRQRRKLAQEARLGHMRTRAVKPPMMKKAKSG